MQKAIVLFLAASLLSPFVKAGTVTTTADSGPGSLRDAIANAAPGETINFAVTGTITLTSGELLVTNTLNIVGPGAANLTIQRSTDTNTPAFRIFNVQSGIVAISGLTVRNGSADSGGGINNQTTFTLRGCVISGNSATNSGGGINNLSTLTMSNCVVNGNSVTGSTTAGGGGIDNQGTLSVINCLVSDNSVTGRTTFPSLGGGVYNAGTLALTNSIVRGNSAIGLSGTEGEGGGICNRGTLALDTSTVSSNLASGSLDNINSIGLGAGIDNANGTVTLNRSTVANNLATGPFGWGAGINNSAGTVIVESSTVSGNVASSSRTGQAGAGGGIANLLGSVTINHSTITANILLPGGTPTDGGGGLLNNEGVVEIKNTILAGNTSVVDVFNLPLSYINSDGYNLFGTTNGPITPGTNDQFNLTVDMLKLGPLQDNGGPTFTHALLCGSPAINAGDNTGAPPTDQRGFPRIVGGTIDIGAYEYSNTPPTISCSAPLTNCIPGGTVVETTFNALVVDVDGDPLVVVWSVDGMATQTNAVSAAGRPGGTGAGVQLRVLLGVGAHEITAAVSDPSECVATCSTAVTFNPNPTVAAGNNGPICAGSTLHLTITSSTKHSFSWSGPNNFSSTLPNPSITNATSAASGVYTVTVTDANGCTASATTTATVNPLPTVTATNNGPVCAGTTNTYCSAVSPAGGTVTHSWIIGGSGTILGAANASCVTVVAGNGASFTLTDNITRDGCPGQCVQTIPIQACAASGGKLCVHKEIACQLASDCDANWSHSATGAKLLDDSECPLFCYRIQVCNCSNSTLVVQQVADDEFGDLSSLFNCPFALAPGACSPWVYTNGVPPCQTNVVVCPINPVPPCPPKPPCRPDVGKNCYKTNVLPPCQTNVVVCCESTTNTVTAYACDQSGTCYTNSDTAVALVVPIGITCHAFVCSPDAEVGEVVTKDNDPVGPNCGGKQPPVSKGLCGAFIKIPCDGQPHLVTNGVIICNSGDLPLANVRIHAPYLEALSADCSNDIVNTVLTLQPGECVTNYLCVDAVICPPGCCGEYASKDTSSPDCGGKQPPVPKPTGCSGYAWTNHVETTAQVDLSATNVCVYWKGESGTNQMITVRTECDAYVGCLPATSCRVTGSGKIDLCEGFNLYPDDPETRFITHSGQVGAPVGNQVCIVLPDFHLGNPCIHGNLEHVRHGKGGLRGNFHANFFDTLKCACLDTSVTPTVVTVPLIYGGGLQTYTNLVYVGGTTTNGCCNPGNRGLGPEPRRAPASKIAITGTGDWADPNGHWMGCATLFRVDIEDRGEPGNSHGLAADKKANRVPDRYRIRIWVLTGAELAQLNSAGGADPYLLNFRNAISACDGINVQDGASVPNGTAAFGVRAPDVDDGGVLEKGNLQIHPSIQACDPYHPTGPGLPHLKQFEDRNLTGRSKDQPVSFFLPEVRPTGDP